MPRAGTRCRRCTACRSFGEKNRNPFVVPPQVPWQSLATVLRYNFKGMKDSDLQYCAGKFKVASNTDAVAMHLFNKTQLPNRGFTFWEWYSSLKALSDKHFVRIASPTLRPLPPRLSPCCPSRSFSACFKMATVPYSASTYPRVYMPVCPCASFLPPAAALQPNIWAAGLVAGFLDKQQVQQSLIACQPGTFLLRFSESVKSGISVSWVGMDAVRPTRPVMLPPVAFLQLSCRLFLPASLLCCFCPLCSALPSLFCSGLSALSLLSALPCPALSVSVCPLCRLRSLLCSLSHACSSLSRPVPLRAPRKFPLCPWWRAVPNDKTRAHGL